jgi:hypothetical protein
MVIHRIHLVLLGGCKRLPQLGFVRSGRMPLRSFVVDLDRMAAVARRLILQKNSKILGVSVSSRPFFARARRFAQGEPVVKGVVSPMLTVPKSIPYPEYAVSRQPADAGDSIFLYTAAEVPKIRKAARLARKALEYGLSVAQPGLSTDAIDRLVHDEIIKHGAYPSPLNYAGFPKSICTSVNEVVCHGIPDSRVLKDGDILSIDVSLYLNGYHGDNCGTVVVGKSDPKLEDLIQATKDSVDKAIAVCKPGGCFSDIGKAIQVDPNAALLMYAYVDVSLL